MPEPAPATGPQTGTTAAPRRPRSVALVGPYGSGKSTLFDAMLAACGTGGRRGATPPAGEMRLAHCSFMGDPWALLDCPGSVEFAYQTACALAVVDLAVVVCDPAPARAATLAPVLKAVEAQGAPFLLFINKIDTLGGRVRDTLAALQAYTRRPLVLRQVPIREGGAVTGYVDVVSERAYRYRPGAPSELIALPEAMQEREREARAGLLETLADLDDSLLEKLIEDVTPPPSEIYGLLRRHEAGGGIAEVLLGAADRNAGVQRLWKALRHEAPDPVVTAEARGIAPEGEPLAQVFRTVHAGHTGKLSYARIWRGPVRDGGRLDGERVGGIYAAPGGELTKVAEAQTGEIVALARMESAATGAMLGGGGAAPPLPWPEPPPAVYALAIATEDRKDDVKLSGALTRLAEEDPSLRVTHDAETGQTVLHGQGEIHLRGAVERLARAHNVKVSTSRPRVAFKEAIRRPVAHHHARLKRQTGGHGQFADVVIDVEPRGRGEGFQFTDRIVGGVIPRNYIPAIAEAAEEATRKGPLGFPVVDVAVTLVHGGFHSVDSSDMAFKTATRMAMQEALAKADPVLLEPVHHVAVSVPSEYTPAAQRLLTTRRGRILGYAEKPGWPGWDEVEALVPEAELGDLIIELRSQTLGLGTFTHRFDHLAEAHGRLAERAVQEAAG